MSSPTSQQPPSKKLLSRKQQKTLRDFKNRVIFSNVSDSLWGVPLSGGDDRADTVLFKFLKFNKLNVEASFNLLTKVLKWRRDFGADEIVNERFQFEEIFKDFAYIGGKDKENNPLCYYRYGRVLDKQQFEKIMQDVKMRSNFIRWRVKLFEKAISLLDFKANDCITEVNDLGEVPEGDFVLSVKEYQRLIIQYYPCIVQKKIYVNAQWYDLAKTALVYARLVPHDKKHVFFAHKDKTSPQTLSKYIPAEYIPVEYGGLCEPAEAGVVQSDLPPAEEISVKGHKILEIEIASIPAATLISWEIKVIGWDVKYSVKYIPDGERFTINVEDARKIPSHEEVMKGKFKWSSSGKLLIRIDNSDSSATKMVSWRPFFKMNV